MIAITGAAGFIGSNLAHRLAALGHRLLLVDRGLTPAKAVNWAGLRAFAYMEHEPFLESLVANTQEVEAVFHLGACSRTTETDWTFLRRNNVAYSQRLWECCGRRGVPLLYASSAATYGDGSHGFDDRTPPRALHPLNLYGKSKNDFDAWVLEQVEGGRPAPPAWAGLKFFNVYGPHEAHKGDMASVVHKAYGQAERTGAVSLFRSTDPAYPDGGQRRDFVFVGDCVNHLLWLWQHPSVCGLFNSGTGQARTFAELARAVFAALGREPHVRYVPMPTALGRQYQKFTQANMSKLREAGYDRPPTSLEDGVRQTLAASNPPAEAA